MSFILCRSPQCQTTAGCVCGAQATTPAPMTAERLAACKAMYRPGNHAWSREIGGIISDVRHMLDHIDALTARIAELERQLDQALAQRDEAEEAVGDIYFATIGEAAEWSNQFEYSDAIEAIAGAHKTLGDAVRQAQAELAAARKQLEKAAV